MKLGYLPEFATLIAAHARLIAAEPSRLTDDIIGQQYIACRDRANNWMGELERTKGAGAFSAESLLASQHPLVDLVDRILTNDMLIRVWASVLSMIDRTHEMGRFESIAKNMHSGQLVIRNRALRQISDNSALTSEELKHVEAMKTKVERWTDLLLGQLPQAVSQQFAFDAGRARDFASTYQLIDPRGPRNPVWSLVLGGVRTAFHRELPHSSLVSADDRAVLTSILAGLSPNVTRLTYGELGPRSGSLKP